MGEERRAEAVAEVEAEEGMTRSPSAVNYCGFDESDRSFEM